MPTVAGWTGFSYTVSRLIWSKSMLGVDKMRKVIDFAHIIVLMSVVVFGITTVLYQLGYTNSDALENGKVLLERVFMMFIGVKGFENCVGMCANAYVKSKTKIDEIE